MTIAPERWAVPRDDELAAALAEILGEQSLRVVDRRPVGTQSTFPSEVIRVQVGTAPIFSLYSKYSAGPVRDAFGHRGGVPYEAEVYRGVLATAGMTTPRFVGVHHAEDPEDTWLFLEYLDGAGWVSHTTDSHSMTHAAKWIAEFHNRLDSAHVTDGFPLILYDAEYFHGWIRRTYELTDKHGRPSWLLWLAERADDLATRLAALPKTVIHGEFTTRNVLWLNGIVCVVDWESAAIGPGEIDLAFLTDGWPPGRVAEMERSYSSVRVGSPTASEASQSLDLARLYMHTRWLGDRPEWARSSWAARRLSELRRLAESLGLN